MAGGYAVVHCKNDLDDADNDSLGNAVDYDSDGDGVADQIESVQDSDGDGVLDYLDNDSSDNATPAVSNGSGCSIVSGARPFDPFLFLLFFSSMALLWRGRRIK